MGIGNFSIDDYKPINLKAINNEALQIISETEKKRKEVVTPSSSPLQVSSLDNVPKAVNGYMSFEAWIPMLSKIQHDFVTRSLKGNERLEGAAGTGKTISLVLKAIWLYRTAKYGGKNLRMLFLCHSIATKENLKNINSSEEFIEIPVINKTPEEIDIEKIHEDIYKEVQDAYYTKEPFTIHPEVEGVDFNIEEAKALLQEDKEQQKYFLKE